MSDSAQQSCEAARACRIPRHAAARMMADSAAHAAVAAVVRGPSPARASTTWRLWLPADPGEPSSLRCSVFPPNGRWNAGPAGSRYTDGMRKMIAFRDPDTADDFTDDPDVDSSWM